MGTPIQWPQIEIAGRQRNDVAYTYPINFPSGEGTVRLAENDKDGYRPVTLRPAPGGSYYVDLYDYYDLTDVTPDMTLLLTKATP